MISYGCDGCQARHERIAELEAENAELKKALNEGWSKVKESAATSTVELLRKRNEELEAENKKDSEAFKSEFRWRKELEKENEELKAQLGKAVKALERISNDKEFSGVRKVWYLEFAKETLSRLGVKP